MRSRTQILFAVGVGSCLQNLIIAVQADVKEEREIPQATALVTFSQVRARRVCRRLCWQAR